MRPAFLLAMVCLCVNAEDCPWLNTATAGGALGGTVSSVTVKRAATGDDASCTFIRRQGSVVLELAIETETLRSPAKDFASYAARCSSDAVALKGIGNEALACTQGTGEQVISRVRERAFVVRIQSSDSSAQKNELREKARKIAEMIAGLLF